MAVTRLIVLLVAGTSLLGAAGCSSLELEPWVSPYERNNLAEAHPDINRPHDLLATPDGKLLILAGTPGYGYTGIIIATLGALNAWGVALAALFIGLIDTGSQTVSRALGVPAARQRGLSGKGVRIGIADTGVDGELEQLAPRLVILFSRLSGLNGEKNKNLLRFLTSI